MTKWSVVPSFTRRPARDRASIRYEHENKPQMNFEVRLTPGDAVAAIILLGDRYLLQHRDARPDIFFPDHWGCFGGNVEFGEDDADALVRELAEELGFSADAAACRYFTRFEFDFSFARRGRIYRVFYELTLPADMMARLTLGEGQGIALFDAADIIKQSIMLTPYDAFALWMHINRDRLKPER